MIIGCGMSEYDRQNEKVVHHCHCQSLRRPALVARCLLLLLVVVACVPRDGDVSLASSLLSFMCDVRHLPTVKPKMAGKYSIEEFLDFVRGVNSIQHPPWIWERFDLRQINGKKSDTYGYNMDTDGHKSIASFCSPSEQRTPTPSKSPTHHTIR